MTEQKLDFTRKLLVLGNFALLAWVFLAFLSVLFYTWLYSWLYLILSAFIVYAVLRRIGCGSCYQCKTCTSGFGRLAGVFFGRGFVKKASAGNRIAVIAFIYFLLLPFPAAVLTISLVNTFSTIKVLVFIALLVVSVYSLTTWYNSSTTPKPA